MQHLFTHFQFKVRQKAETNLQPPELGFRNPAHLGETSVRVADVFEGLHGDSKGGEEEAVGVTASNGDNAFNYCEAVDVEGGGEIDGCGHGTVFVQAEEIFLKRDGRRSFRVEFPRQSTSLDVKGFRTRANDMERFRRMCFWRSDGSLGLRRDIAVVRPSVRT